MERKLQSWIAITSRKQEIYLNMKRMAVMSFRSNRIYCSIATRVKKTVEPSSKFQLNTTIFGWCYRIFRVNFKMLKIWREFTPRKSHKKKSSKESMLNSVSNTGVRKNYFKKHILIKSTWCKYNITAWTKQERGNKAAEILTKLGNLREKVHIP